MTSVLLVDFGAIARRGLLGFLDDAGVDVVTEPSHEEVPKRLAERRADVVLLNLDDDGAEIRARAIADAFPGVKVIACSSEWPRMLVVPPDGEAAYMSHLSSGRLEAEVMPV